MPKFNFAAVIIKTIPDTLFLVTPGTLKKQATA